MLKTGIDLRNPYPGLRPFEAEDAAYFFGRDRQVDELLLHLRDHRFVAVLGQSGSGKSSLVRAGLIPALKAGHLTSCGSRWRVALFRPGSQPLEALAAALDQALGVQPDRLVSLGANTQALRLQTSAGREPDESLLVVVDQFEEIFRVPEARQAAHFIDLLLAVEQDISPSFRVYVTLTMRTDRLGECARFDGLPEALNRGQYLVPKLANDQLREAIEGPAALTETEVAPEVVQQLAIDASEGRDQLPLLQHLLMTLWERRETHGDSSAISYASYEAIGSAAKALNDHADRVLAELPAERQPLAGLIFRALTESGEGRDQRRPQRISQLAAVTGAPLDEVRAVVEHFFAASFLTSPDRGRTDDWEADITHESLIRQWEKLGGWVAEEAKDAEDYRYFAARASRSADPLTGVDLGVAIKWLDKRHNAAWAARYGGDYQRTRALILSSSAEAEHKALLARTEALLERAKLRRQRSVAVGLAMGMTAVALFLWLAYFYRTVRYYSDFAWSIKGFIPVDELSSGTVQHRGMSFKITRQGLLLRRIATMEPVDSAGKCRPSRGIVTYGAIGHPCHWDWVYDQDGHVASEVAKDQDGNPLYGVAYYRDTTAETPTIIGVPVGRNGFPTSETNIRAVQFDFDKEGMESRRFYYDSENRPTRDPLKNLFGEAYEYNRDGRKSKETSLDQNRHAVPDSGGVTSWSYEYDPDGNMSTAIALDAKSSRTLHNNGYSIVRYKYDQWGNETEHSFFDVNNKEVADRSSGAHTVKTDYDDHWNPMPPRLFGVHGEPLGGPGEPH
jgi:energy-coupling factor transporter ATP-binding protein EcfA2